MFTETVTIVNLGLGANPPMPGATPPPATITVTLRQASGGQFTISDDIANAAKYVVGATLQHTVGTPS